MTARSLLTFSSVLTTGLMGGFFFAWMVSVIPGTRRTSDRSYIETMQHINRAIINPAFIVTFLAPPLLLVAAAIVHLRSGMDRKATLLFLAAGTYVVGVLAVTMTGNVPLNNALDTFDLGSANDDQAAVRRTSYERPWNRWHNLRTGASVAAFSFASAAILVTDVVE